MSDPHSEPSWLTRPDGLRLAVRHDPGQAPCIVFLHGLMSHMEGEKARFLSCLARAEGWEYVRLGLSGHGRSEGAFAACTISQWRDDVLLALDHLAPGPVILVGSSIGGWIALLTALARPKRVVGLIGLAAAPDFTQRLMWEAMAPSEQAMLQRDGVLHVPNQYGDPPPITLRLIEDGARHLLLTGLIPIRCPVRLLHGQADPDVPWSLALRIAEQLETPDARVILVKDGDHRLSRPPDLALLRQTVAALLGQDGA